MNNTHKLTLHNVSRHYPSASGTIRAITDLNLTIPEGEFLCIVGHSGCGKTTLLNLIAGFEHPDSGSIHLDGKPATTPGPDRFVLFQEPALFPWLNVRQNIAFGLKMNKTSQSEQEQQVSKLLQMVHLTKFANAWIHELSGGMKQRVALARALAMNPDLLLMDEPFAALDAQTRDLLHEELERIWQQTGKTVVFVTHNVREAVRLATRVILMAPGGVIRKQYPINLPRNRYLEDSGVAQLASMIRDDLKAERLVTDDE